MLRDGHGNGSSSAYAGGRGVGELVLHHHNAEGGERERVEEEEGVVIPVRPDPNYLVPGWAKRRREERRKETLLWSPDWPPQVLKLRCRRRSHGGRDGTEFHVPTGSSSG